MTELDQPTTLTLRSIAPSVYLPAMVYEIGNGATAPVIALTALHLGASPSAAGFMVALLGVGQVLGDIPASAVADRIGDRHAMVLAAGLATVGLLGCFLAPNLLVLGLALLLIGSANSTFYLARQSYLTEVAPVELRARALSTLGGSHRIGLFIGPFVGAAAISLTDLRAAYVVAMVTAVSAGVVLLVVPDVALPAGHPATVRGGVTSRKMLADHRRLFATLGLAILAVGAVRAARQTVLPLWAEHLGLGAERTSLIFGIAGAVDMALFYPAGKLMDRYGRLAVALPSMTILGAAMMALPLTSGAISLTVVAMVMSFGNGIGSGIMMTLGADAAPAVGRIKFLGIWRVLSDSGNAAGPVVMSVVASAATLAIGIVSIGSAGLLAAAALAAWVPRYSRFATPRAMAARRGAG
ncbi:Predicted arabinose efflux permease, MFS family [Nakamurella panacisegetis]|uniref:Predicted arabinose efflux permease, MFS family n=1 Tax=Nakamurella panacisegetis TaxID=1090615 RepID=A0A1H0SCL2_9ACTN|nr:MFS transporter [Nakamurella panacisegetis]SDP39504.1 Predicted arabinose efflux permease, MFS family [Nakamurella panacisegetis]